MHAPRFSICCPRLSRNELILNPWLTEGHVIEKIRSVMVGSPSSGVRDRIKVTTYSIPVHLPELGSIISLDLTAPSLKYELKRMIENPPENALLISYLYNFDERDKRAVSWGNFRLQKVKEEFYQLYAISVYNGLLFTPSIIRSKKTIWSPNRCIPLRGTGSFGNFRTYYCYNVFVAFIDPSQGEYKESRLELLGVDYTLADLEALYIELDESGHVTVHRIKLQIPWTIMERIRELPRGYYIVFTETFNSYSEGRGGTYRRIGDVNVVTSMMRLIHSPYDVVPFLYPHFMSSRDGEKPLIEFIIPRETVRRVIRRFEKFAGRQNQNMIHLFEDMIRDRNPLLRITESEGVFSVELVNPTLIPSLIRCHLGEGLAGNRAGTMLRQARDLIKLLKEKAGTLEVRYALTAFNQLRTRREEVVRCLKNAYSREGVG